MNIYFYQEKTKIYIRMNYKGKRFVVSSGVDSDYWLQNKQQVGKKDENQTVKILH